MSTRSRHSWRPLVWSLVVLALCAALGLPTAQAVPNRAAATPAATDPAPSPVNWAGWSRVWAASGTPSLAADGDPATEWVGDSPAILTYIVPGGVRAPMAAYSITAGTTGSPPSAWTLQGSANGRTWTVLDRQAGQTLTPGVATEFTFANTTRYVRYRLNARASSYPVAIAELGLCQSSCTGAATRRTSENRAATSRPLATSQDGAGGHPVDATLDGLDYTNWASSGTDSRPKLTYRLEGSERRIIRSYYVRAGANARRIPNHWLLEGSRDGKSWSRLDRRQGALSRANQTGVFTIATDRAFTQFRLNLYSNRGRGPVFEVADVGLCELTCDTSPAERSDWTLTAGRAPNTEQADDYQPLLTDGLTGGSARNESWDARAGTITMTAPRGLAMPVTHYQLATASKPTYFPSAWRLEGSNDGVNWTLVDERDRNYFGTTAKVVTFNTRTPRASYRTFRLVTASKALMQFSEVALCPVRCDRLRGWGDAATANPVTSDLQVAVDGASTTNPALTSDTAPGTWTAAATGSSITYSAANGQGQNLGGYTIAGHRAGPTAWTVWGRTSSTSPWRLLQAKTNERLGADPQYVALAAAEPLTDVRIDFPEGSPATLTRLRVCTSSDCQTGITGPPPGSPWLVWSAEPGAAFGDASLLGNGPLGASVYGGVARERILLNEHQIWTGAPYQAGRTVTADVRDRFAKAVAAQDKDTALALLKAHMLDRAPSSYQLAGNLLVDTHQGSNAYQYRRWLDPATAAATVSYVGENGARYTRRTFASFADPIIASNFAVSGGTQDLTFGYDTPVPGATVTVDQRTGASASLVVDGRSDPYTRGGDSVAYRVNMLIRAKDGKLTVTDDAISVRDTSDVDVMIAIDTNVRDYQHLDANPVALASAAIENNAVKKRSFDDLYQRHLAAYRPKFDRVDFTLPADPYADVPTNVRSRTATAENDLSLMATNAQYSRYLLMASSTDSEPANLQGRWNPNRYPQWWSDYHLDINLQMNYSFAETLNVPETTGPLFSFIQDLQTEGQRIARDQYGIDNGGWVAHITSDLWRQSPVNRGAHTQWTQGGTWIAQSMWNHYTYSKDETFLRDTAYPTLKANALFFDDFLVESPIQGDDHLVVPYGTSPENQPTPDGPKLFDVQVMPTMDAQLVRELYEQVIEASKTLGVDAEQRATWEANLARLPDPAPIGKHGTIKEWYVDMDRLDDTHRHISHLYGAAMGTSVDLSDPTIFAAVDKTVTNRGNGGTGWAEVWRGMIRARMGQGDAANDFAVMSLNGAFDNLYSNATNVTEIDATFGVATIFGEMLVQSHTGTVDLLPALPSSWTTGKAEGLRAQGGFTIQSMTWANGALTGATIRSEVGGPLTLRSGSKTVTVNTTKGQVITVDGALTVL